MQRRAYLRSTGAGLAALTAVAGCLADGGDGSADGADDGQAGDGDESGDGNESSDGEETVDGRETANRDEASDDVGPDGPSSAATALDLRYPEFRAAFYHIRGAPATAEGSAIPFAELSREARVEVASGVAREQHRTAEAAVLDEEAHQQPVEYRGRSFDVSVGVADRFQEPEYGPESGPGWEDPVEIALASESGELIVQLRNRLGDPLPVHHVGRPYFGVLTAVGESAVPLAHDAYETNEFVREESGLLRTDDLRPDDMTTTTLAPDGTLTERYGIPDDRPDPAHVWLSIRIGDESVDRLGNRAVSAVGTHVLE